MKLLSRECINLIKQFTISWFKLRDQRTILGFFWSFLNPLIMTAILYFLFKTRIGEEYTENYFLYILIGTVSWNFFAICVQANTRVLLDRALMVRNVVFPKEILIFSNVGVYIIQHFFEILVVFVFIIFTGVGFSAHVVILPLIVAIEAVLIASISLILSCICVYARDIEHIWTVIARMGFFLVPIFYKISSLSKQFRWIVMINPMSQVINFYRDVLIYHKIPNLTIFATMLIFSFVFLAVSYKLFKSFEPKIVEKA
ncbi:MAG: ABC transporter permease [Candidatus Omnitrophota bacterium]|nr:ABC transporter permease [Candidatus Omnitrophota bacterium]